MDGRERPHWVGSELWFPPATEAVAEGPADGLVAVGGDLSVPRLLLAYRSGLFPWSVDPVTWWSPDPRGVLELEAFHVPRSLRRFLRPTRFRISFDQAFLEVMEACAEPVRRGGWITKEFIEAYSALHRRGYGHSVECWQGDRLVGGVYGVAIGAFFAGESMFHRVSQASKVALVHLVDRLKEGGFRLFDLQMVTPVTQLFGARLIPRREYLERLGRALGAKAGF